MCATLMEKVGKTPTERLFIREVGLPEAAVVDLIELGHTLLGYIFDVSGELWFGSDPNRSGFPPN